MSDRGQRHRVHEEFAFNSTSRGLPPRALVSDHDEWSCDTTRAVNISRAGVAGK
jgi:hypothetical protein